MPSTSVRIRLYGMMLDSEYGIITHPAQVIYVMIADQVFWKWGHEIYSPHLKKSGLSAFFTALCQ